MSKEITYRAIPVPDKDYWVITQDEPFGITTIAQSTNQHPGIPLFDVPDEWKGDDVEKLAKEYATQIVKGHTQWKQVNDQKRNGFIAGYNHHASTHPFTLEDMQKKLLEKELELMYKYSERIGLDAEARIDDLKEAIVSIQQPKQRKEYEVELEMEDSYNSDNPDYTPIDHLQPKITEGKIKILSWK